MNLDTATLEDIRKVLKSSDIKYSRNFWYRLADRILEMWDSTKALKENPEDEQKLKLFELVRQGWIIRHIGLLDPDDGDLSLYCNVEFGTNKGDPEHVFLSGTPEEILDQASSHLQEKVEAKLKDRVWALLQKGWEIYRKRSGGWRIEGNEGTIQVGSLEECVEFGEKYTLDGGLEDAKQKKRRFGVVAKKDTDQKKADA